MMKICKLYATLDAQSANLRIIGMALNLTL